MKLPATALLAGLALAGTAAAWVLLQPLPWPARALTTVLVVPLPLVLMLQARLVDSLPEDTEREAVYLSSALSVWILAAFAMIAARFSDFSRDDLRLVGLPIGLLLAASILTLLAGLGILAIGRLLRLRESPLVHFLIPRSGSEKIAFVGLSLSAGIAEEIVFRSFLIATLLYASGSMTVAVGVSIVIFAASHAYQGWTGVLRVGILGLVLTIPFLVTGSVYPSIIAHAALDILAGLVLADWLRATPRNRT
jgi:uncharacterized protein